ncbi:MAG: glycosyltransferase family 1 protein [Phototrophicales bacterium]|nr:MAG: glycosyltransferase family 1 protein [Phototrophicales bacterium]RMG73320.1 MAG: glycosyltransferase family 1 protein [Chloroflexota bacterium]
MIGIDARITAYRIGGISTYILRLIEALEKQLPPEDLKVFQSRRASKPISQHFLTAKLWTPPHHRLERLALSAELLPHRLEVLHSPDFIPPWHGAKKHIITVHDLTFVHFPQHKDRAAQRYYNQQIETAVKQADHILSVSEATKRDLIELLNVSESKITVQPHGVDPRFKPGTPSNLGLPPNYILFVGTLEPRKNIPLLLDAYAQLKDAPPLVLVGRIGWLMDDVMPRLLNQVNVIHRDDISDEMLPAVYQGASMLVLPSHYEGFGLPLLEAMACGTPVIAANNSSLPEVVGNAGLLVEIDTPDALKEAMQQLLDDSKLRDELRQKGLEQARQFTWENSARIALEVYRN